MRSEGPKSSVRCLCSVWIVLGLSLLCQGAFMWTSPPRGRRKVAERSPRGRTITKLHHWLDPQCSNYEVGTWIYWLLTVLMLRFCFLLSTAAGVVAITGQCNCNPGVVKSSQISSRPMMVTPLPRRVIWWSGRSPGYQPYHHILGHNIWLRCQIFCQNFRLLYLWVLRTAAVQFL